MDVEAFESAAAAARRSQDTAAYRVAIDLYAGELLPEDLYERWAEDRRHELRTVYLALLVELWPWSRSPRASRTPWTCFRGRGVQVIAIDVKEPPEVMRPFRDRYGWSFPVWLDQTGDLIPRFAPQKEFLPPEVAIR